MLIGDGIRAIREAKNLSQGDIEKRTGVVRSYISRVENGHTIPSVETLEKLARALEFPSPLARPAKHYEPAYPLWYPLWHWSIICARTLRGRPLPQKGLFQANPGPSKCHFPRPTSPEKLETRPGRIRDPG